MVVRGPLVSQKYVAKYTIQECKNAMKYSSSVENVKTPLHPARLKRAIAWAVLVVGAVSGGVGILSFLLLS